jgi:DNA primase
MERDDIHSLANLYGITNVHDRGEWVSFSCPFAPWTHEAGSDEKPSFGISVGDRSNYNCFACGRKGVLSVLPTDYFLLSGKDNKEAREFIYKRERLKIGYKHDIYKFPPTKNIPAPIVPEDLLITYPFIEKGYRGLSQETIESEGLRYDEEQNRLLIPIRNEEGNLVGVKGRALSLNDPYKYLLYTDISKTDGKKYGIWYGMHHPREDAPLIIVEGEIDALLIRQQFNRPVWAAMGVGVSQRQVEILADITQPIVLFMDNDKAGQDLTARLRKKLLGTKQIGYVSEYHGCNDPAELCESGKISQIKVHFR